MAKRASEDIPLIRFMVKLSKKAKGAVDMELAKRAFELLGWKIEDTKTVLDLSKSTDGSSIIESLLKSWWTTNDVDHLFYDWGEPPKTWMFKFESHADAERGLSSIGREMTKVTSMPTSPTVGTLYMTAPSDVHPVFHAYGFHVKSIWLGLPGWTVTTASGVSMEIPVPIYRTGKIDPGPAYNSARFWTFIYKNKIDEAAKKYLDKEGAEIVEDALRTKSQRQEVQLRRQADPEIEKVFREITDKKYKAVVQALYEALLEDMALVVERQKDPHDRNPMKGLNSTDMIDMMERDQSFDRNWVPRTDHKAIAQRLAKRRADEDREAFIVKNTARVSAIAKLKNNFKDAHLLRVIGGHTYGGEIKFSFEDGSSFLLRNKTIWKRSSGGVVFTQFPTTFHDVVMPDGSKMPAPSEKRMMDVFAVATAPSPG